MTEDKRGWIASIQRWLQIYVVGNQIKLLKSHAALKGPVQLKAYTKLNQSSCFRVELSPEGIAVITIDVKDAKVNTLGKLWLLELMAAVAQLELDPEVKGFVLISGKENDFVSGLDIKQLSEKEFQTTEGLLKLTKSFQDFLSLMEGGKPKVAAVHGACLGGGLELALACHVRVATSLPQTSFALPEVKLGVLPGAGGTQRLPALIGIWRALPLLLTGAPQSARAARRLNILDVLEGEREMLLPRAVQQAAQLHDRVQRQGTRAMQAFVASSRRGLGSIFNRAIEAALQHLWPVRALCFWAARSSVFHITRGNYPAPPTIIQVLESSLQSGVLAQAGGYLLEREAFARLALTPQSSALRAVFFGTSAMKKKPSSCKQVAAPDKKWERVGIRVPSDAAGPGIAWRVAQACVESGVQVKLVGDTMELLSTACFAPLKSALEAKVRKGKLTVEGKKGMLANIILTRTTGPLGPACHTSWHQAFSSCQLILDPSPMDAAAQQTFVALISPHVDPEAVFAFGQGPGESGTWFRSLMPHPRVVGLSFACPDGPSSRMVEIVRQSKTSEEVLSAVWDFTLEVQKKLPLLCAEGTGLLLPRVFAAFARTALEEVLAHGFAFADLDQAIRSLGFSTPPFLLTDLYGIAAMAGAMKEEERRDGAGSSDAGPGEVLDSLLRCEAMGAGSGAGFYVYPNGQASERGKRVNPQAASLIRDMTKSERAKGKRATGLKPAASRVMWAVVAAAVRCWEDGVVGSAEILDTSLVVSLGWPPFRGGGPLAYVDEMGCENSARVMTSLGLALPKSMTRTTPATFRRASSVL